MQELEMIAQEVSNASNGFEGIAWYVRVAALVVGGAFIIYKVPKWRKKWEEQDSEKYGRRDLYR
jgi:hypothetical protein